MIILRIQWSKPEGIFSSAEEAIADRNLTRPPELTDKVNEFFSNLESSGVQTGPTRISWNQETSILESERTLTSVTAFLEAVANSAIDWDLVESSSSPGWERVRREIITV